MKKVDNNKRPKEVKMKRVKSETSKLKQFLPDDFLMNTMLSESEKDMLEMGCPKELIKDTIQRNREMKYYIRHFKKHYPKMHNHTAMLLSLYVTGKINGESYEFESEELKQTYAKKKNSLGISMEFQAFIVNKIKVIGDEIDELMKTENFSTSELFRHAYTVYKAQVTGLKYFVQIKDVEWEKYKKGIMGCEVGIAMNPLFDYAEERKIGLQDLENLGFRLETQLLPV